MQMAVRYCDTYDPQTRTCTHSEHMAREWRGRIHQAELNLKSMTSVEWDSEHHRKVIRAAEAYIQALKEAARADGYNV